MSSKGRTHREEAWRNAKKICRLNRRQVEMARALGMNPKKLPRLRPSPRQRWKLPVGEFIEACYWKRFGHRLHPHPPPKSGLGSSELLIPQEEVQTLKSVPDAMSQVEGLVCYFMNLTDDLEAWLAHGIVDSKVLPQLIRELREIVHALENGEPVLSMPEIPSPPGPPRHRSLREQPADFDDEIPF